MPITLGLRANKGCYMWCHFPLPLRNRIVCTTKLHVVFMTITQKGVFRCQSGCLGLIQLLSFVKIGVCSYQVTKPDSTRGTSTEDVWIRLWIALYKMKVDCYSNTESIILLTCGFKQQINSISWVTTFSVFTILHQQQHVKGAEPHVSSSETGGKKGTVQTIDCGLEFGPDLDWVMDRMWAVKDGWIVSILENIFRAVPSSVWISDGMHSPDLYPASAGKQAQSES